MCQCKSFTSTLSSNFRETLKCSMLTSLQMPLSSLSLAQPRYIDKKEYFNKKRPRKAKDSAKAMQEFGILFLFSHILREMHIFSKMERTAAGQQCNNVLEQKKLNIRDVIISSISMKKVSPCHCGL